MRADVENQKRDFIEEGKRRQTEVRKLTKKAVTAKALHVPTSSSYLNVVEIETALANVAASPNDSFTSLIKLPNKTWEKRSCAALKIARRPVVRPARFASSAATSSFDSDESFTNSIATPTRSAPASTSRKRFASISPDDAVGKMLVTQPTFDGRSNSSPQAFNSNRVEHLGHLINPVLPAGTRICSASADE